MKKSAIAIALALGMGAGIANAVDMNSATFTMLDGFGGGVGLDTTVTGSIGSGSWAVASTTTFFGLIWTAHAGTTFGPGTYSFNTADDGVSGPTYTGVVVGSGQVGGHILFDWGITANIDVVNVWDIADNGDGTVTYASTDATAAASEPIHPPPASATSPDGIRGIGMIDGSFPQFHANFDFTTSAPPVANDDSKGTTIDTLVNIDLVANDSAAAAADPAASSPAAVPPAVTNLPGTTTQGGTLIDKLDGSVDYTPPAFFVGSDDFQYTLTDESGRVSGSATVAITVSATANTPPVANDATKATDEDVPVQIDVKSVATDADGDSLTYATFDAVSTQGGAVTVDGTNTILTYSPAADFNGTDTFTYSVTDGIDDSDPATITVIVNPVNDAPVCEDVTLATAVDTPLDISVDNDLLSTCSDPDGDTISLAGTTQPTQPGSTLADDGAGTLTYTPATGFEGQDSFTYTATDGTVSDTRTVFVDVSGKIFGNFTMLNGSGETFGGTNDVVFTWDGTCYNSEEEADAGPANMTFETDTPTKFFGFVWEAHDIKVFCPRLKPYVFDTCNDASVPPDKCGPLSMTVPPFHLGGHVLFDWNVTDDIDVAIVWNNSTGGTWQNIVPKGQLYQGPGGPTPALDEFYDWISVDADGDGIPGIAFVDGPFISFRANFSFKTSQSGGGDVVIPESSISSPNLGSTNSVSCTISNTPVSLLERSDWLVLAGLMAWLGFGRLRRRRTH